MAASVEPSGGLLKLGTKSALFGITFGVVAKYAIRKTVGVTVGVFRSSDFEAREIFLTFLEVVEHALLESPFVQNGVIGIGACAVEVIICSRRCHWNWGVHC
ncbi:hypothetical protein C2G38_2215018 [Gigaspora rosea]|uniref:Uncharacterized protein n=1 Tax=Gigaspora rosea TaxID=44941 RepID=A0A397UDT6_9GLOM|nr:hypothetical protein C2G38_2215018 [Gigaspora rosea]